MTSCSDLLAENVVKKLNVPEHIVVSVAIWDLPGREEVDLRKSYYQDVDAAIGKQILGFFPGNVLIKRPLWS